MSSFIVMSMLALSVTGVVAGIVGATLAFNPLPVRSRGPRAR